MSLRHNLWFTLIFKGFYFTSEVEEKQNLTALLVIPRESDHSILGQDYQAVFIKVTDEQSIYAHA